MWDQRYGREAYIYGKEPNDFLVSVAGSLPKGRILCIAEGEGRNGVWLAERGHDVTAVDASSVGLEKAGRLARERGVELRIEHADLADFAIGSECWDAIVSIFCHLPPTLRRDVFRRCAAGLRPGGLMVVEAYRPEQLAFGTGGPSSTDMMMTEQTLKEDLDGLDFEILRELERDVIEGEFHSGRAAVVQALARKP